MLIPTFSVVKRVYRPVGERKDRVKLTLLLGGTPLLQAESEPFGHTSEEVQAHIEQVLGNIRQGLSEYNIDSKVIREMG